MSERPMRYVLNMPIIGIAGQKHTGKTTAAEYLQAHRRYYTTAFADPLKAGLAEMFRCDIYNFFEADFKHKKLPGYNFTPVEAMQKIGTEGVRDLLGEDTWLDVMDNHIVSLIAHGRLRGYRGIVISDIRMPNEYQYVKMNGGLVVHMNTDQSARQARVEAGSQTYNHSSEQLLPVAPDDIIINNNGSLEELYQQLDHLVELVRLRFGHPQS